MGPTKTAVATPDPEEPQPPWATVTCNGVGTFVTFTISSSAPVAYSNGTYTA